MTAPRRGIAPAVALLLASLLALAPRPEPAAAVTDPAAAYVDATFTRFLGRDPTAEERSRWVPTIELGHRGALTRSLAASDEWAGSRVDQLYRDVLGRPSEAGGRAHWVARIGEGHTLEAVAAFLYGSDEYLAAGGSTLAGFVDRLYAGILGRGADDGGRRFWVGRLASGMPRSQVASAFYASIESRSTRVTALYRAILGRAPDPGGHEFWVEQVARFGDIALAAHLAASDEQYRRVTGVEPPPEPTRGSGTGYQPYAWAAGVLLAHPAAAVEAIGLHESGHDGSKQQDPLPTAVRPFTMETRDRGTGSRTAADVVVPPGTEIRSPVTGTVKSAGPYLLYCRHLDHKAVIQPDGYAHLEVTVLHVDGMLVQAGDRVAAGLTVLAPQARLLPFASQVDDHTARPSWPHVHVEVLDPSVPDRPSGGC